MTHLAKTQRLSALHLRYGRHKAPMSDIEIEAFGLIYNNPGITLAQLGDAMHGHYRRSPATTVRALDELVADRYVQGRDRGLRLTRRGYVRLGMNMKRRASL